MIPYYINCSPSPIKQNALFMVILGILLFHLDLTATTTTTTTITTITIKLRQSYTVRFNKSLNIFDTILETHNRHTHSSLSHSLFSCFLLKFSFCILFRTRFFASPMTIRYFSFISGFCNSSYALFTTVKEKESKINKQETKRQNEQKDLH